MTAIAIGSHGIPIFITISQRLGFLPRLAKIRRNIQTSVIYSRDQIVAISAHCNISPIFSARSRGRFFVPRLASIRRKIQTTVGISHK